MQCSAPNCDKSSHSKGFCRYHYWRWKHHGDPLADTRKSPTSFVGANSQYEWIVNHSNHIGSDCLYWPFQVTARGYAVIELDGERKLASRVMCRIANGRPPDESYQSAHSCGNGMDGCIHPAHLRWATPKENMRDQRHHGTIAVGERHGRSKLTADQVRSIRSDNTLTVTELSRRNSISRSVVAKIKQRKIWAWLPDDPSESVDLVNSRSYKSW